MTIFKRLFLLVPLLLILVAAFAVTPAFAAGPAVIVSESAEQVTATTATIEAEVNPEGYETIVYLEYGSELYAKPVTLPAGVTVQEVTFALKGSGQHDLSLPRVGVQRTGLGRGPGKTDIQNARCSPA